MNRAAFGLALSLVATGWLPAHGVGQAAPRLTVGLAAMRGTYNEVSAANRQSGFGGSAGAAWDGGAWAVEGDLNYRTLSPREGAAAGFDVLGGQLRARYTVWRELDAEVGLDQRSIDPEFAAQDVAALLVGARYDTALGSLASMWIRGAAIPKAWFNGGGEGGIGVGIGFGARMRPTGGRWGLFADYEFQRIDRSVQDLDVPIQFESVRLGFSLGLL